MVVGGLHIAKDTGAPNGAANYKTLVLLHGLGFHSQIFTRLLPFANDKNCRLVLVNRRGYPGADPLSNDAVGQLQAAQDDTDNSKQAISHFMRDRAYEVHSLLKDFIIKQHVPALDGIILVGWSLASIWITAFLTYAPTFSTEEINVGSYIRRVVTYDPPYRVLGLTPPQPALYNPFEDPTIPDQDRVAAFGPWITGYFEHRVSETVSLHFEDRVPLSSPPPTLENLAIDDVMAPDTALIPDVLLYFASSSSGVGRDLFDGALYQDAQKSDSWDVIEWRYVWCDRSAWVCAYGARMARKELEQSKEDDTQRLRRRKVSMVRWHGANHFPHWDFPRQTLEALLTDADEDIEFA